MYAIQNPWDKQGQCRMLISIENFIYKIIELGNTWFIIIALGKKLC